MTSADWVRGHPLKSAGLAGFGFAELATSAPRGADLTGPVFGTAATLAALVLAVAALVSPFALTGLPQVARLVFASKTIKDAKYANDLAEGVETSLARIPPAFNLLMTAFVIAAIGLFRPSLSLFEPSLRLFRLPLSAMLVGATVALDVIGLFLLVPVAAGMSDVGLARTIANTARQRLDELSVKEQTQGSGGAASPTSPIEGERPRRER